MCSNTKKSYQKDLFVSKQKPYKTETKCYCLASLDGKHP